MRWPLLLVVLTRAAIEKEFIREMHISEVREEFLGDTFTWDCSVEEDRELIAEAPNLPEPKTIGLLYLAIGNESLTEFSAGLSCLRQFFNGSTPERTQVHVTLVHGTPNDVKEGCTKFHFFGGAADECWNTLMQTKLAIARMAPYDVTVLMDADVFANPLYNKLDEHPFHDSLLTLFKHNFNIHLVGRSVREGPIVGSINGGFVAYRRSNASDRFFSCVAQLMASRKNLNEQTAYDIVLKHSDVHPMASVGTWLLPPEWNCRGLRKRGGSILDLTDECMFIHTHIHPYTRNVCPLPLAPEQVAMELKRDRVPPLFGVDRCSSLVTSLVEEEHIDPTFVSTYKKNSRFYI